MWKMNRKLFLLNFFVKLYSAQLLSDLFVTEKTTENNKNEIKDFSIVTSISRSQEKLFSAVSTIANMPYALSRLLEHIEFPHYLNSDSNSPAVDKFLVEFGTANRSEDATLDFTMLVNKYGLEVERYEITTEDGYVLSLLRIVGNGSPVFLMHGLLGSADDFIVSGPDSGLAYLLADKGYDVWLGNARGNKYSRRHISLQPTDSSFWDFSWHEIGFFDLPVMVDYVLLKTNRTSLKYVGFSQGTTVFFVMASERPEYNKKVSVMIALSPIAFMKNVRSPIVRILAPGTTFLQGVSTGLGQYEFLPDRNFIKILKNTICGTGTLAGIVCSNIIFLVTGFDFEQLNVTNLPVIFGHFPSGASIKQFFHYGQGVLSDDFRKFDYGSIENFEKYGSMEPPSYSLNNIETPVSMFFSYSDWLAHPQDVAALSQKLKNVLDVYMVPYEKFNHIDFIIARDVKMLVYNRVIDILK